MAGTVTTTEKTIYNIKKISFAWTATTGEADATTTEYYDGQVMRVVELANTSTGGWGLQINDSDGVDLLGAQGASMSSGVVTDFGTSTGGTKNWSPLSAVSGQITLEISSASTGSTGTVIVYIR